MALHFNSSLSLSPPKLFLPHNTNNHTFPTPQCFRFFYVSSCSFSLNKRSTSGSRKKAKKSNVELCNEIKEFLASVGLPQDHVPSTKELSAHGRNDLANIVRRRGYKLIGELLANSLGTSIGGHEDKSLVNEPDDNGQNEKGDKLNEEISLSNAVLHEETGSNHSTVNSDGIQDISSSENISIENANSYDDSTTGPIETSSGMTSGGEGETSPSSLSQVEGVSCGVNNEHSSSSVNTSILESSSKDSEFDSMGNNDDEGRMSTEPYDKLSMEEKLAKFMQEGYLGHDEENRSNTAVEEHLEDLFGHDKANASYPLNGSTTKQVPSPAKFNHPIRDSYQAGVRSMDADGDKRIDEEIENLETQEEINRLRIMLHQKELELSRLKEQIEKEKITLSVLQTKAEDEISKAQKLISEKDAELQVAEQSLSGLTEVTIQYTGEGNIVEVAGSFNGWHHPIKMDPEPSLGIGDPAGLRKSRVWSTMLWLYPGEYEIKFIVDGQWKTDPQRESITKGTICNNVLRVER